ncbi:hypothetical protein CROQUDRAFT_652541 [Cronartium quercuum f. sp. fusiforme G11]|uniref:ubiquitinyl hydrolase 1 n=1 Tax=Cronartium quercuum f. sp. fusiforme G11 TaxID=708437 RepID=A0A9P6NQI8_9BASI|nr:hypothetical protein CROQUDRAFT_652541 [Cronartium quercuum f. sp. fusiforme G11]
MSLLRWMGVNNSINGSSGPSGSRQVTQDPSKDEWWTRSGEKYYGMENFGNTCYANSVLQALYFCKPFRELLELSASHPLYLIDSELDQSSAASSGLSTHVTTPKHPRISTGTVRPQRPTHAPARQRVPSPSHPEKSTASPRSTEKLKRKITGSQLGSSHSGGPDIISKVSSGRNRSGSVQLQGSARSAMGDLSSDKDSRRSEPSGSLASPSRKSSMVLSGPQTPVPSVYPSIKPPPVKRNWGAADLDQGGLGSQRPPPPEPTSNATQPSTLVADSNSTISSTLRDLFHHISNQPKPIGAVAPQAFITTLKRYNELFRSTMHQDAHEFLNYLVNSVAEDLVAEQKRLRITGEHSPLLELSSSPTLHSKPIEPCRTWVHQLFEGVLTNETKCLTCETVTQRDESFLDLSIDIEQNTSLTACLRQFSASEMLCQKNKFSCDQCCSLQEAEKRMKIKKLPNVLALHLKRFKYQEELQRYIKLTYRVVFPFELRLFNTTDDIPNPDRLYELWAIVVHIGTGPHHGHYVTILKSSGRWLLFDDNVVTLIEEHEIQKYYGDTPGVGSGYVLFYQAADLDIADVIGLRPEKAEASESRADQTASCTTDVSDDLTDPNSRLSPCLRALNLNLNGQEVLRLDRQETAGTTTPDGPSSVSAGFSRANSTRASASSTNSLRPELPGMTRSMSADRDTASSLSPGRRSSSQCSPVKECPSQQTVGLGLLHHQTGLTQTTRTKIQLPSSQASAYASYRIRNPSSQQSRPATATGESTGDGALDLSYTPSAPPPLNGQPFSPLTAIPSDPLHSVSPHHVLDPSREERPEYDWTTSNLIPSPQHSHPNPSSASLPRKLSRKFMRKNSKRPNQSLFESISPPVTSNHFISASVSSSSTGALTSNPINLSESRTPDLSTTKTLPIKFTSSRLPTSTSKSIILHQHDLLKTRGAQAPPATSSLTSKQQKEIKRATERETRKAQKDLIRVVRAKEKEDKQRQSCQDYNNLGKINNTNTTNNINNNSSSSRNSGVGKIGEGNQPIRIWN